MNSWKETYLNQKSLTVFLSKWEDGKNCSMQWCQDVYYNNAAKYVCKKETNKQEIA